MASYRVNLDIFAGPLDLLLYLVRKDEVDIYDIPLARITEEYLKYVEMLKQIDIDLAGDFLVMASTLIEIKSAMLLPCAEPDQVGTNEPTDPRAELVRQLLEYKKFKDAANRLQAAASQHSQRFARPDSLLSRLEPQTEPDVDLEHISIWNLLEAFDSVIKATGRLQKLDHIKDDTPIDLYQIELLHRLQDEGPMPFERVFSSKKNRLALIGLFLGLLELVREKLVWAEQHTAGSIYLRALTDEPADQAVHKAISAAGQLERETQTAQPRTPPIPIQQLPSKGSQSKPPTRIESSANYEENGV